MKQTRPNDSEILQYGKINSLFRHWVEYAKKEVEDGQYWKSLKMLKTEFDFYLSHIKPKTTKTVLKVGTLSKNGTQRFAVIRSSKADRSPSSMRNSNGEISKKIFFQNEKSCFAQC